jgi:hypothetical protein
MGEVDRAEVLCEDDQAKVRGGAFEWGSRMDPTSDMNRLRRIDIAAQESVR